MKSAFKLSYPMLGAIGLMMASVSTGWANSCPSAPACTVGGVTYTTVETPDATHGSTVEIDDAALTFLAQFATADQSPATLQTDVLNFLSAYGFTNVMFLGRAGDQGSPVSVTQNNGGLSGTWTLTPTSGNVGRFIALHAGGGNSNEILYRINNPGLTGIWDTSENITGQNNDQAALSNFDLFGGAPGSGQVGGVPGPVVGAGIPGLVLASGGLFAAWRRRRKLT